MHFLNNALAVALVVASSLVGESFAHYRFNRLIANGATHGEFQYIRKYSNINSRGPVTDVNSAAIRCNIDGHSSGPSTEVLTVSAGAAVGFVSDGTVSHPGPFAAYLGRAPGDVKNWDGSGNTWFKIWEKGPNSISSSGIQWDTSSSQVQFSIPSGTPSGQYLLRVEHIGLHSASGVGGAQFYISCAQLNIQNGGGGSPNPTTSFPGAYAANHPGVQINIYYPVPTSYTIPGPRVWRG